MPKLTEQMTFEFIKLSCTYQLNKVELVVKNLKKNKNRMIPGKPEVIPEDPERIELDRKFAEDWKKLENQAGGKVSKDSIDKLTHEIWAKNFNKKSDSL